MLKVDDFYRMQIITQVVLKKDHWRMLCNIFGSLNYDLGVQLGNNRKKVGSYLEVKLRTIGECFGGGVWISEVWFGVERVLEGNLKFSWRITLSSWEYLE